MLPGQNLKSLNTEALCCTLCKHSFNASYYNDLQIFSSVMSQHS